MPRAGTIARIGEFYLERFSFYVSFNLVSAKGVEISFLSKGKEGCSAFLFRAVSSFSFYYVYG